jgi:hypothetical protein
MKQSQNRGAIKKGESGYSLQIGIESIKESLKMNVSIGRSQATRPGSRV